MREFIVKVPIHGTAVFKVDAEDEDDACKLVRQMGRDGAIHRDVIIDTEGHPMDWEVHDIGEARDR